MEFLWSRQEKLEGPDNNGGSTISTCVEQLIGGITDILSLENILEATASILEDDEDENELEDELLLQCGTMKACVVDEDNDKYQSDTQTKDKLSFNLQPAISDNTEPLSGNNLTEIQTDKDTAEDNYVTIQNNQNLKPSDDRIAVHQTSSISQEYKEATNENSAQTPSPDAINGTFPENIEKGDQDLILNSNTGTANKEEGPTTELVSHEKEASTTSSDNNKVQSETVSPPADTLDHPIDLPLENILSEANNPPTDTVQQESVDQSLSSSMSPAEPEEANATTSSTPNGEDMQKSDACNSCPPTPSTDVPETEPEGETVKAGDFDFSPLLQMETIVDEDISNVIPDSVIHTVPQIISSESDPVHTDTDTELKPDTQTESVSSSSPVAPLSSAPAHCQDQQGAPASDEPEGGQTASPHAPSSEQGDKEASRGAPINGEQQQPVSSTEPDTHSITEPPGQEPVVTTASELQDQQPGDQPPAAALLASAPELATLPADGLHATPESPPSGLTAQGNINTHSQTL